MGFMEHFFTIIVDYIAEWGYLAIVLGMALESACMPVPSEVVLPFAGYLVSRGDLSFAEAVSAGLIGGMVGSVVSYTVGRIGGRPFLYKYGRRLYFIFNEENLAKADSWVDKYGDRTAFWARFLPVVRTFVSLPLGIAKMPFGRFLLYSFAGSIPWTIALVWAGKALGDNWGKIAAYGDWLNYVIIAGLLVVLVVFIRRMQRAARYSREESGGRETGTEQRENN